MCSSLLTLLKILFLFTNAPQIISVLLNLILLVSPLRIFVPGTWSLGAIALGCYTPCIHLHLHPRPVPLFLLLLLHFSTDVLDTLAKRLCRSFIVFLLFPKHIIILPMNLCVMLASWVAIFDYPLQTLQITLKNFDLIHCELWTSPVASVSDYKYYLVILDDCSHFLRVFQLQLKSETFSTLTNFFTLLTL